VEEAVALYDRIGVAAEGTRRAADGDHAFVTAAP
jgi:hypothetical protein